MLTQAREPESTRRRMAACLGMEWEDARPWLLLMIACHDLGKACPGFQCKWIDMTGLQPTRSPNTEINHAFVSQIALTELLRGKGWPDELAELVADAVGCHHGNRASPITLNDLEGDRRAIGKDDWVQIRRGLVEALLEVFKPIKIPTKQTLTGPDFMLLSGLTSFADWIGSNEDRFPFGTSEDCDDLEGWFKKRSIRAEQALDAIGWEPRTPLSLEPKSFEQVFKFSPRPLQQAVADVVADLKGSAILLVEAPMARAKPRPPTSRTWSYNVVSDIVVCMWLCQPRPRVMPCSNELLISCVTKVRIESLTCNCCMAGRYSMTPSRICVFRASMIPTWEARFVRENGLPTRSGRSSLNMVWGLLIRLCCLFCPCDITSFACGVLQTA